MARKESAAKNHDHPGDPHLRNFNSAMQVQRAPSKTITSGGEAPQMSMPLLPGGKVQDAGDAYARMLSAKLPEEAPPARPGARLASFFCCGGGIDLGFRSAGFELAFANDISARAVETFGANLGHAPLHRDIREVGPKDYPEAPIDVVTGGFPCTTFSMAGKRMGVTDDLNGKLYLALCRVIEELSPRYFVAENVEGILSANGGAAVKYVVAAFLRLGYRTDYQLVNMAEHGVPQTRKRVIFVGVRLDQWRGSFRFPAKTHRLHDDERAPRWLPPARTLREAIGDLPPPNEKLLGMMHGDAAEKLARGPGVSSYQSSKPRRADRPSHSQTTQGGVLHEQDTVPNHGRKLRPLCEKYNSDRTKIGRAAKPSPTIISESISPWVPDHDENTSPVSPTHAMSKRVARGGRRAPTVVSEASNVQPWLNQHEVNDTPAYPSFAQASNAAPGGRPAPTVSTPKQNAPFVASGALNAFDKSAVAGGRPPTGKNDPSPTILSTMPPMLTGRDVVSARNPDFFNPMRTSASPSPTMTAGGQTEVAERGGAMRRMTVRECARVQSFPDWYEFKGSQADGYTLVGNAVPPLYARRLAEAILEYDARELAT